jgi:hypothetical protein
MKPFLIIPLVFVFASVLSQTPHTSGHKQIENKKTYSRVSFKKDIFPIMKNYCLPCHTEDQMNPSQLYLDSYENMMAGGKHGKPILPGKADSSIIVQKLSPKPPFGDPMPMKRKTPFPKDTLQIIRQWIEQGAKNN